MRSKVTLVLIVLMLGGLAAALVLRPREPYQLAATDAAVEATPAASGSAASGSGATTAPSGTSAQAASAGSAASGPSASGSAAASAKPSGSGAKPSGSAVAAQSKPSLGRPMRVVASAWSLAAAGIVANDGTSSGKESVFSKAGQRVEIKVVEDAAKLQNALARGGEDPDGADIAVLPLQSFVASYEGLQALNPAIFFVAGWSRGSIGVVSSAKSFSKLPASKLKVFAPHNDGAAFVALYALDLAGVSLDRVERSDKDKGVHLWALPRREAKKLSGKADRQLLLTTGEAAQLVPYVAVAKGALLSKHPDVLTHWATGWLQGQGMLAADASAAARRIAVEKGGPEPMVLLAQLSGIKPASLSDNAVAAGLSGRGAVTLRALFKDSWRIWRSAEVLTIPPTDAPIDSNIIAGLVRAGGKLELPRSPDAGDGSGASGDDPIVVHRVPKTAKGKLDQEALIGELGMLAGIFGRSPLRLSAFSSAGVIDPRTSKRIIEQTAERYGVDPVRLSVGKARPKQGVAATIEIMPVP